MPTLDDIQAEYHAAANAYHAAFKTAEFSYQEYRAAEAIKASECRSGVTLDAHTNAASAYALWVSDANKASALAAIWAPFRAAYYARYAENSKASPLI